MSPLVPLKRKKGEEKYPSFLYPPRQFEGERGSLVWAKVKCSPWWPGILVNSNDCGQNEAQDNFHWVFWLKDGRVSQVNSTSICDYKEHFKQFYKMSNQEKFVEGILDAIKIVASRSGQDIGHWTNRKLLSWAEGGFVVNKSVCCDSKAIPDIISQDLAKLRAFRKIEPQITVIPSIEDLSRKRMFNIDDSCIGCRECKTMVKEHPLFEGSLCEDCLENLKEGVYAIDEEGVHTHCAVCAKVGTVFVCGNIDCFRVYCLPCIDHLAAPGSRQWVEHEEPWSCFYCKLTTRSGFIIPRTGDPSERISSLFTGGNVPPLPQKKSNCGITVLSLFDGIGTGLVVLKNLGIKVERYYASEVDVKAVEVCKFNHKEVIQIGDVTKLPDNEISKLQVDLLIGGSPCTELSLVNPARKGLFDTTATGFLFFEYYRILTILSKKKTIFWLFENTAAMERTTRNTISRFFDRDPVVIDAVHFSAQRRARLFWGNIPGLGYTNITDANFTLEQCLLPGFNRKAKVKKIRTVTSNPSSLLQGKTKNYPIDVNGSPDRIWITELEMVFGFPIHYTDTGNINLQKRYKLLGKSWSVPAVQHILRPLTSFFINEKS